MSLISYAQNYEDIILWRALKHIENGFYIDVGAYSPSDDSVTKLFYGAGWRGINIEPNPIFVAPYNSERNEDINLSVAVSNEIGEAEMFFVSNPGLSSLSQKIAESHGALGWKASPSAVKVKTLASICKEYCPDKEIHFLKIDIEGFEKQALQGNDWARFRPWVIVVEATLPMSKIENYKDWEPILTDTKYIFAYADGLNRFYISEEHQELLPAFKYPPNIFDEFKLITTEQAEAKAAQAEAKVEQAEAKVEQIHAELRAVYASRSWRSTEPLRWSQLQLRLLHQKGLFLRIKALARRIIHPFICQAVVFVNSHPRLRFWLVALTRRLGLYKTLRSIYLRLQRPRTPATDDSAPRKHQDLSSNAHRIYVELKDEIAKQQAENN